MRFARDRAQRARALLLTDSLTANEFFLRLKETRLYADALRLAARSADPRIHLVGQPVRWEFYRPGRQRTRPRHQAVVNESRNRATPCARRRRRRNVRVASPPARSPWPSSSAAAACLSRLARRRPTRLSPPSWLPTPCSPHPQSTPDPTPRGSKSFSNLPPVSPSQPTLAAPGIRQANHARGAASRRLNPLESERPMAEPNSPSPR